MQILVAEIIAVQTAVIDGTPSTSDLRITPRTTSPSLAPANLRTTENDNIPTENIPTEDILTEDIPAEDIPAENIPTEDIPTENISTENIPTENIPTAILRKVRPSLMAVAGIVEIQDIRLTGVQTEKLTIIVSIAYFVEMRGIMLTTVQQRPGLRTAGIVEIQDIRLTSVQRSWKGSKELFPLKECAMSSSSGKRDVGPGC